MRRVLALLASMALVAVVLISASAAPAAPAPQRGGALIVGSGTDATTLDSHLYSDAPTATIMEHITETLFELTPAGKIQPRLALSQSVSADGRTWTIRLRTGVRFHDGTPFDAEAAKFNLDRVLNPATRASFRFLIDRVTSVTVVDPSTIRLVTNAPFAPLLAHLAHSGVAMQSPAAMQRLGADYAR